MTLTKNAKEAKYFEAPEFYCTEKYYTLSMFGLVGTDGCIHAFKTLESFWVGDIIASYISKMRKTGDIFFVARVVAENNKADFFLDDGNGTVIVHQKIPYTDIKQNLKLYVQKNGKYFVALLPSEY